MLSELRQKIDAIDDKIIALLAERTHIVEEVGKLKAANPANSSFIRPGREATMLRRLMTRITGPFPKAAVAQLWRIIIAASLNIEQKLQISVYVREGNMAPYWYSREYFGAFTHISTYHTVAQVISEISQEKANVGVLPLPQGEDAEGWWCDFQPFQQGLYIFAHIPFIHSVLEKKHQDMPRLIAIAKVTPEETMDDKTLIRLSISSSISQGKINKLWEQNGLQIEYLASTTQKGIIDKKFYLLEVKGFFINECQKIEGWVKTIDAEARVTVLGAYAVPVIV